jgi:hypothetical protein
LALSAFADKSRKPGGEDLKKVMGRVCKHWMAVIEKAEGDYPPLEQTWGFSGTAWGWALRLKQKTRTIMYLTPCKGYFIAGFALGEKAVRAAKEAGLDESTLSVIDRAPRYAEGRTVRIEVRRKRDREQVMKLAAIKMEN